MNEFDMGRTTGRTASARERGDQSKKIFIGGVPRTISDDEYREYFATFGVLDDCILMRDQQGICRGFGFVTYRDQAAYEQVMDSQLQLGGRALEQKKAIPRSEGILDSPKAKIKIFVGGLSPKVDNNVLYEHFTQYGEVIDSIVMMDAETGNSRGFGFVTFSDPGAVEELMKSPKFDLCGKMVECKRARPLSRTTNRGGRGGGARSSRGGGRPRDYGERYQGVADIRDLNPGFDPRYDVRSSVVRYPRDERYDIDFSRDRMGARRRVVGGYENPVVYPDDPLYRRELPRYEDPYRERMPIRDPWMEREPIPVAPKPERSYSDIYEYKIGGSVNRYRPY